LAEIRRQKENILDEVKSEKDYKEIERLLGEIDQNLALVKIESDKEIKKSQANLDLATRNLRYHQASYGLEGVVPKNKKTGSLKHYGVLFGIAIVEFALLAMFYAESSNDGYLGGLGMAIMLSGLNMGLAYLISEYLFEYKKPFGTKKIQGIIGAITFSCILLVAIIFAAHFRFAIGEIAASSGSAGSLNEAWDASKLAWVNIVNHGLLVSDVMSWFLIFTSIAISVVFVRKLQSYQNTSNKHWDLYQAVNSAKQELEISTKSYLEKVNAVFNLKKNEVENLSKKSNKRIDSLRQFWDKYKSDISVFKHYVDEVEDACNRNLSTYRVVNRQIATSEAPAYFSSKYALPDVTTYIDEFHNGYMDSGVSEIQANVNKFDEYVASSVKNIQEKQKQYFNQLHI